MGKQHFQLYSKIHQAKHRRSESYHWVDMDTECESAGCNMSAAATRPPGSLSCPCRILTHPHQNAVYLKANLSARRLKCSIWAEEFRNDSGRKNSGLNPGLIRIPGRTLGSHPGLAHNPGFNPGWDRDLASTRGWSPGHIIRVVELVPTPGATRVAPRI